MADREIAEVLDQLDTGLGALLESGPRPIDAADAVAMIGAVERLSHRLDAAKVALLDDIDQRDLYRPDGHASAKAMVRHVACVDPTTANQRARTARMLRNLPAVKAAFTAGELGSDQATTIAKTHANPRVRHIMVDAQDWFLRLAASCDANEFAIRVREWERLTDADGPTPPPERTHQNRDATLIQDHFELSWILSGNFGASQGATMRTIFDHYTSAERLTDWEQAKAQHGDNATAEHLPRTEQQRRADALHRIFNDAANNPNSAVPASFQHVIVWSAETYAAALASFGTPTRPRFDPETYRCETIDGTRLDPVETAAESLDAPIRRAVVNARSVVIDLGESRRFTGLTRLATQLWGHHCPWPGCQVPTSHCEIDHLHQHAKGGQTNPNNGIPLCGRHNRLKQKGFSTYRDPAGHWHIRRPDGTELT